ncbi:MAG: MarR family transcriptional regulator, partial [Christensenellaceae bacterium]|nr:MarR family transcriptional regulator [Christensenellaceae bacterium]
TPMEILAVEMIYILNEPTISEFTQFAKLSSPNAAYKIGKLVKKGYVEKIQSTTDKREYYLKVTDKYIKHYNFGYAYVDTVINRVEERFNKDEIETLNKLLAVIGQELMHEVPNSKATE